ncbi:hypothetical protein NY99_23570, partial [Xanthomonas phaseoli pv. phaseoli]
AALDRIFACLVAGGAGAFLNALKHHVVRKHGTGGLRGVFQGRLHNRDGEVVARVRKQLYVKRKPAR